MQGYQAEMPAVGNHRGTEQSPLQQGTPTRASLLVRFSSLPLGTKVAYGMAGLNLIAAFVSYAVSAAAVYGCGENTSGSCNREFMGDRIGHVFSVAAMGSFATGYACQ